MDSSVCLAVVHRTAPLVQTEITCIGWFAVRVKVIWNIVPRFMVPRGGILLALVMHWFVKLSNQQVYFFSKMWQLFQGLPWNLENISTVSRGWIPMTVILRCPCPLQKTKRHCIKNDLHHNLHMQYKLFTSFIQNNSDKDRREKRLNVYECHVGRVGMKGCWSLWATNLRQRSPFPNQINVSFSKGKKATSCVSQQ